MNRGKNVYRSVSLSEHEYEMLLSALEIIRTALVEAGAIGTCVSALGVVDSQIKSLAKPNWITTEVWV